MKYKEMYFYLILSIFIVISIATIVKISSYEQGYKPSKIIPFWFWNGDIQEKEIVRQLDLMQNIEIKEVIIHPRTGLKQKYLSEEWFDLIGFTLKQLKKRNMKAWVYDEFDWPSGRANNKILFNNPNLVAKNLKTLKIEKTDFVLDQDQFNIRRIVSVIDNKSNVINLFCSNLKCSFPNNKTRHIFYQDFGSFQTEFTNEYYTDLLDPRTTTKFIEYTHDEYYERFNTYFGGVIVGFFTDEPGFYANTYDKYDLGSIAWTSDFEAVFFGKKNYNITEYLLDIWSNTNMSEKVRADYFEVRTDLYVENYFKKLHNWTSAKNVLLTGHVLIEENLYDVVNFQGDFFKTMQYLDIPGGDDINNFDENKITPILVSSAKKLYNKSYALVEAFGGYGDLKYEDLIISTDWLAEKGIDIIVPHAFFYTANEEEYQPSFFFQNTKLWPKMKKYVNYAEILKSKPKKGKVIYPIKKAWSLFDPNNSSKIEELDNNFKKQVKGNVLLIPDYYE